MKKKTVTEVLAGGAQQSDTLVMGPTLGNKDHLAFDILVDSWTEANNPFVITATDPEAQFRSRFESFVPTGYSTEDLYVIDCTEQPSDSGCSVNSPVDLTGIGICLSKGYEQYGSSGGRRILLDNISTLRIYSDMERVFRFISTVTQRVSEAGDATVQLLDRDALGSEDRNRLFQLFPTVIEVRDDANTTLFRIHGETETEWYEYQRHWGGSR